MAAQVPYQPVGWAEGVSSLGPANLNHMEEAVRVAYDAVPAAVNQRRITGLALGSTSAVFCLTGPATCYALMPTVFGQINLQTGQYTGLAAPGLSAYTMASLVRLNDDQLIALCFSGTSIIAKVYTISTNAWGTAGTKTGLTSPVVRGAVNPLDNQLYVVERDNTGTPFCCVYDPVAKTFGASLGNLTAGGIYDAGVDDGGYLYALIGSTTGVTLWRSTNPLPAGPFAGSTNNGRWYRYYSDPTRLFVHGMRSYLMAHYFQPSSIEAKVPDYTEICDYTSTPRKAALRGPDFIPRAIDFDSGVAWLIQVVDTSTIDLISASFPTGVIV